MIDKLIRKVRLIVIVVLLATNTLTFAPLHKVNAGAPTGFTVNMIAYGQDNAGAAVIAFAPGNRIYIAEKRGIVRVWQNGVVLSTSFVDLSNEVNNYNERGLLGIAVHPDFPAQPYLYLYYTFDFSGSWQDGFTKRTARVERIAANSANLNVASTAPGSRIILMGDGYCTSGDDIVTPEIGSKRSYVYLAILTR